MLCARGVKLKSRNKVTHKHKLLKKSLRAAVFKRKAKAHINIYSEPDFV